MPRTRDLIFIQQYTTVGDATEQKRAFFKHVAKGLHDGLGVRLEDVFINIVIEIKENWWFGKRQPWNLTATTLSAIRHALRLILLRTN